MPRLTPGSIPRAVSEREAAAAVAAHLERGRPVSRGGGREPVLALTFDDGPDVHSRMLVDALRRAGAPATFFAVGERAALHPDVIREQRDVGEVGSHSLDHALLTRLPEPAVRANLTSAGALLHDAGAGGRRAAVPSALRGVEPRDRRPPRRASACSRSSTRSTATTGASRTARACCATWTPGLRPGAIVLLHEVCPHTVQAVPDIVAAARRRGLRLVTVPELLALDPPRSRLMVRAQRWGDHRRMTRARAAHRRDGGWDTRSMAVPPR